MISNNHKQIMLLLNVFLEINVSDNVVLLYPINSFPNEIR